MDKIEPVAWMYADKSGIFQLSVDKRNPDAAYWTETPLYAHPAQHDAGAVERVARTIANAMGDNFADAFKDKSRWIAKRGKSGGRFRDVNEPTQADYLAAAKAALAAMKGSNNE